MADRVLMERSLRVLKICGMHPGFTGFYQRLKYFSLVMIFTFNEVLLILEMALNWKGTDTFENGIEVIFGTLQITLKSLTTFIFRRAILLELNKMTAFWPTNKFGEELEAKLTGIYVLVEKAFNSFLIMIALADFVLCMKPQVASDTLLPFKTYKLCNTNNNLCYVSLYLWQILHMILLSLAVCGMDGLFCSFLTHAFCQLKMIQHGLGLVISKNLSEEVSLKRLGELVSHHVLILDFVKSTNRIFSLGLLTQLSSAVFNLCTIMFLVSVNGFPPTGVRLFRYLPMLVMVVFQLFIYCLAGSKIVEECSNIADAAFFCPWSTTRFYKLRKALCLVIQRAHRNTKLSVAGLIDLNIETFGTIMRRAASLYMAIQQLHRNEIAEDY